MKKLLSLFLVLGVIIVLSPGQNTDAGPDTKQVNQQQYVHFQ